MSVRPRESTHPSRVDYVEKNYSDVLAEIDYLAPHKRDIEPGDPWVTERIEFGFVWPINSRDVSTPNDTPRCSWRQGAKNNE